jgi:hypothetical protein
MFIVPSLFGEPVYVWSGILLFVLVFLQIGVGKRWIPVDFRFHRWNGLIIAIVVLGHAFFAVAAYLFGVPVQGF